MSANTANKEGNMDNKSTAEISDEIVKPTAASTAEKVANDGVKVSVKINNVLELIGFTWFIPIVNLLAGENPAEQFKEILKVIGVPVLAMLIFVGFWGWGASKIHTSLGAIPGPVAVWEETKSLADDHYKEKAKEVAFYQRQDVRNAKKLEKNPDAVIKIRAYTGKATYPQQIVTSLVTVFAGFVLASIVAIPLGVICGLSPAFNSAINPIIQIFKPVSPLAWLPIVTLIVSALYTSGDDASFSKSFLVSAITVTLCSLWPTLINTAVGVATIDKDLMNVSKVLQLGWWKTVTKIVLPSSLPMIFTGLRLSLGVGWMVLIAAEMLAQNPGLGKFVWDEFQNGSQHSLGKIMVAVFTIGIIGFMLDRIMLTLQKYFSYGDAM
ncbi:MAG: ABC transporter permease [Cycloclasticus sp.]